MTACATARLFVSRVGGKRPEHAGASPARAPASMNASPAPETISQGA